MYCDYFLPVHSQNPCSDEEEIGLDDEIFSTTLVAFVECLRKEKSVKKSEILPLLNS